MREDEVDAVDAPRPDLELESLTTAQQELDRLRTEELRAKTGQLSTHARQVPGGEIVAERVTDVEPNDLRALATEVVDRIGPSGIVTLGIERNGKAFLVAAVSLDLLDHGIEARQALGAAARAVGGGAGGRGAIASAGGRHGEALDQALANAAEDAIRLLDRR
ncbi:DHHA1 domain-containing protein [Actinacidiphila oryziradicis]|uniref:DHHA1 domain-containing protein n=1 Tax=Actinacidiphila oryziradicis TaxID=2571141 RepID=UPI00145ED8B0|nr:DHHA1 domain-containing protein [Actinacidiphila oryziradicis]